MTESLILAMPSLSASPKITPNHHQVNDVNDFVTIEVTG